MLIREARKREVAQIVVTWHVIANKHDDSSDAGGSQVGRLCGVCL